MMSKRKPTILNSSSVSQHQQQQQQLSSSSSRIIPQHHDSTTRPLQSSSTSPSPASTQSPSRRSPKSPPRSPSWIRHRRVGGPSDSPTLSPPPPIVGDRFFPDSHYPTGRAGVLGGGPGVEEYEIRLDDGHEFESGLSSHQHATAAEFGQAGGPPKPARVDGGLVEVVQQGQGEHACL